MKNIYKLLIIICIVSTTLIVSIFPLFKANTPETLYQVSTLQALIRGGYDGGITIKDLLKHGANGLGTFDGLDGEMIIIDGKVYKGKIDGKIYRVKDNECTPFANIAFIKINQEKQISFNGGYENLKTQLNKFYPMGNMPTVFYINGDFKNLTYRSVPMQKKPYPPLTEVVKKQSVFNKSNIKGTIVGFRFPSYMKDINANGYHLHFISQDKNFGGHLLSVEAGSINVKAQNLNGIEIFLPKSINAINLEQSKSQDIDIVEK